jgi:glycosyltransferase involved in cell wall biosynthesis
VKISLILTSFDRQAELSRSSDALLGQTFFGEIELVFVKQGDLHLSISPDHSTIRLVEVDARRQLPLSEARNLGLKIASGDIVGFPDDDCWYKPELLAEVTTYLEGHPAVQCICTNQYDPVANVSHGHRSIDVIRQVTFASIFKYPISSGIFVRGRALAVIGGRFNTHLGADCEIGSGEETEFIARLLSQSQMIHYVGTIAVYHLLTKMNSGEARKQYRYGIGFGYLIRLLWEQNHYVVFLCLIKALAWSVGGIVLGINDRNKRAIFSQRIAGIIKGLLLRVSL